MNSFGVLFVSNSCFRRDIIFCKLMVDLSFRWAFIVSIVLIVLCIFLIPAFISVNVQFELIVRDKLWSLQIFFFFFVYYKSVFCVSVGVFVSIDG